MKFALAVIAALILSGCGTAKWYEAPTTGPTAKISYEVVDLPSGTRVVGSVGAIGRDLCNDAFAELATREQTNIVIAAEQPMQFVTGYVNSLRQCTIGYAFTPTKGAEYVGVVAVVPLGCRLAVYQILNGRRVEIPWQRACRPRQ
jgi:hypothetical protein